MGNKQGHELSPEEKQKLRDAKEREKRLLKEEKETKKKQKKEDKKVKKDGKKKGIYGGASSIGDEDAQSIGGSSVWSEKSVADSQPESWYHSASEPASKRSSIYLPASAGPGYYQHDCWARGYEDSASGSEKSSKTPSRSSSKVRVDTSNLRSASLERYPLGVPTGGAPIVHGGSMDLNSATAKKYLKDRDTNTEAELVSSMVASRYEETIRSSREKLDRQPVERKDLVERATLLGKYRESVSQEKVDNTSIASITSKSTVSSAYASADEGSIRTLKSSIISTYHSAEEGSIRSIKRKSSNEGSLKSSVYLSADEGSISGNEAKRMTVSNKDTGSLRSSVYYSADEGSISGSESKPIKSGTEGKRVAADTSSVGGGSIYYSADEGGSIESGSIAGSLYYTATSGSEVEDHPDDDLLGKDRPSKPGQPEGVDREGSALSTRAYVRVENDALLLRWDPPQTDGGSPITGYIMEKCEGESSQWVRVNLIPIKNTEYAVANLIGGRDYRFRVSVENAVGCSDPSSPSESVSISVDQEGTEPHFLRELRNVTAIEGQRVEFTVDIVGTPMPDVTWYKDGFELYDTKRYEFIVEGDRYTLSLKTAKLNDSGDIRVRATNRAGVANSQAILNVNAPPNILLPPSYEQGIIFDTDELIRLRVPYTGRPQPIATWLHNQKELVAGERFSMDVSEKFSTLKIAGASRLDKGMYTINLENEIGKASSAFFVTVTDRPDPPSKPAITDVSGTSVSLRWENPADDGGCRISYYTVEYFRVGWDVWLKAASSHIPWTQLTDLIVGSEYKFRVKAENAYGVSEPGQESEAILIEEGTSPPGSFDYETYKSTTAAGSSLPADLTQLKGDSTSFESGEGGSGSDAEGYAERLRLRGMGYSDELGSSEKEHSLDLGTSSSEKLNRDETYGEGEAPIAPPRSRRSTSRASTLSDTGYAPVLADLMDVDEDLRGDVGPTPPPRSPRNRSLDAMSPDSFDRAYPISTPSPRPSGGTVTARMEAVTVAAGGEAVLVVALEGIDAKTITWQKGGHPLDGGSHYTTTSTKESAQLLIHGASSEDTGTYTAVVTRQDDTQARAAVALRVAAPGAKGRVEAPVFVRTLSNLATKVGTRVRFLVELRAASDVQVYWYHKNQEIQSGPRHRLLREGNFFCVDIAPLTVADEGTWRCVAENSSGQATSSSMLRVVVPKGYRTPVFLEELEALLTAEGTVSLECKVVGVPTPVLKWYKDGKEIKAGDVFALTANPDDPTSLGTYTCEAVNCMGIGTSSSKVRVMSREGSLRPPSRKDRSPTPVGPPPKLLEELIDKRIKIGDKLKLNINVIVPPDVLQIIWYNKGRKIEESEKYRLSDEGGGNFGLEVSPVELGDDGEWKVVIKNQGGYSSSSCKLTLTVPRNYRTPRFLEDLKALLTEEGLVSFECKVVGYPTPILQWFKDGQELKPGDVYQLSGTNSLGKYSCIAKNSMGEAKSSAELTLDDIKSHLNEEEKEQLLATNVPPRFMQGLKSRDTKIGDPIRLTVQVTVTPAPTLAWYHEDEVISESAKFRMMTEDPGFFHLDISTLQMADQGEWKCMASNEYGHSVTTANIKLVIPRHYKTPVFLEPLRAVLSQEGTVNLECKVIGVPQPSLKWFKDGVELQPGDIHRIISGEDGTCCLGTYTCEASNCMGSESSSAALLGFEDKVKSSGGKSLPESPIDIMRNPSLSTIQEERSSQISIYESVAETLSLEEEQADISVSIDGREVSISLYETPDISEAEAKQIAEIYADEISDHLSAHESNHAELPPLRFTRQTSKKGPLLMEAMVIDVENEAFDEYMSMADVGFDDLRTEADVDELSAMEAIVVDEREPLRSDIADMPEMEVWGEEHVSARTVSTEGRGVANINEANILEPNLRSLSEQGMSMLHTHAKGQDVSIAEALIVDEIQVMNGEAKSITTDSIHKTVAQRGLIDSMNVAQMEEQIIMSAEEMLSSEKAGKQAQARRSIIAHDAVGITTFQEVEEAATFKSDEKSLKKLKKATAKTSRKEQEALVVEQVEVIDGQRVQSMQLSQAQAQHALEGQVSAAGVAMQQEQDFYTAAQDIPESFVAEETEADFSEIHSTLEPMQYSEHYGYEHAQEFEGYSHEEQRAMEIEASYRQALGIDEREGYIMAEDFTVSGGQETQAHVRQTLHEAVGGYEALMLQEADVDVVFNREDMSHMLTQAQEKTGSLAECIVIEEADLQSEAAIISQRPAVKPETAAIAIVEGAAESAIIRDRPVVEEMDVDIDAKKRSSGKTGSTDSLNLEAKAKKSKTGSTDSLNFGSTDSLNLTPDEIKAKKAVLIKKMEEMRAKKEAIENEVDLSSIASTTESTDKKESDKILETNKLDMQKTAQDAVEMIDAMSAILTEQEKMNGEVNKPNIQNKVENEEKLKALNELEVKKQELLARKQDILARQEDARKLLEQCDEPTSEISTMSEMSRTDYDSTLVDSVIETLNKDESFISHLDVDVNSQLQDLELTMKEIEKSLQLGSELHHTQVPDQSLEETSEELTFQREKEFDMLDGVSRSKSSSLKEKKEKRSKRSISKEKENEKRRSVSKEKELTEISSLRSSLILSGEDAQDSQTAMEIEMGAELAVEEMEAEMAKRAKRSASREIGEELGDEFHKRKRSVSKEKEERSKRSLSKEKENKPSIASSIYKAEEISMDIETEEEMIALEKEMEAERREFESEKRSSGTDLDRSERSKRSASKEKTSKKSKKNNLKGDEAKIAMGIDPEELTGKEYTSLEHTYDRTTDSENESISRRNSKEKRSSIKRNSSDDKIARKSSLKKSSSGTTILTPEVIRTLSPETIQDLTPENIKAMSLEAISAFTPDAVSALSPAAVAALSPEAVQVMTPEAIKAMTPECMKAIPPNAIKVMSPEVIQVLSIEAIKAFTPEAVKALTPEAMKAMSLEQVKAITREAIFVMSPETANAMTPDKVKAMHEAIRDMSPEKARSMSPDSARMLSPNEVRTMSPTVVKTMNPEAIQAIPSESMKAMSPEAVAVLSPEVVKNLSPDIFKSMTPEAVQALSPEAVRAMSPEAVRALSPEVVKVMYPEAIEALSPEAVRAMSPEAVRAMSPEAIMVMSPGAVRAMSPEVIRAMTPEAVKAMSPGALRAMSPEAVSVISSETIGALSPEAVRAMSPEAVKAMSPEAINAMSPEAVKALTPEVIRAMSPEAIMAIAPEAVMVMSVESVKAISTEALKAMSPEAAQAISSEVKSHMSYEAIEIISPKAATAQILTDIKSLSQPETVKEMTPRQVRAKTPESFKALSPDAVKMMTPEMVEALTPEAVQSMTPAAVHAMTPEAAKAISPEAISCMSPEAVKAFTPDAIRIMSPEAIHAITPEAVRALSPDSMKAMSPDAVHAMSPEAIGAITPNALKAMSPETIKVIPPEAIQILSVEAVKVLTVEDLKAMPVEAVQAFSSEAVSALSKEAVKVITPKVSCAALHGDAKSITPDVAQSMSPLEIKVMSPETANQMSPEAVKAISPKAMEAMSPESAKALPPATVHELSPNAVRALSPEAVKVLSPEAVKAITPEAIGAMLPEAVKALSPKAVQAMTPEAVNALSPESVTVMSPDAIKSLSPDAIKTMSPDAVKAISPAAVKVMSSEAIKAISPEAIKIMPAESVKLFSADALESMSIESVQAISSEALSAMSTESVKIISPKVMETSVSGEVKEITPETAKTLSPVEIRTMSPEMIRAMSPEVVKSISPESMRALSPEAIKSLPLESVKELTPEVVKALTPEVVKAMSSEAIQSMTPEAINAMTPNAVKAISPEVVKSLSPEAVQSLSPTAVKAMSPEAVRALSPEAIHTMSPEAINALTPEAVRAMSPESIKAITPNSMNAMSPEAINAMSPNAVKSISPEVVKSLSPEAVQSLSPTALRAMSPEAIRALSPEAIHTMSPEAVTALSPEVIHTMSPEAITALSPEAVRAMSPESIKAITPNSLNAMSPEAVKAISPEAVKVLSVESIQSFSFEALQSMSVEAAKAISSDVVSSLSSESAMEISVKSKMHATEMKSSITPEIAKSITPMEIKTMSPSVVQNLTPETIKSISPEAIKAITPECVKVLSPEAVKAMSPQMIKALSPEAIKAMTPEAVKVLSPEAVKGMSPEAVKAMSPESIKAMTPEAVKSLSPQAVKAISPAAISAMTPEAIKSLPVESVKALSPQAVKALSPEAVQAMSPEVVKAMSPQAIKAMTPEAVNALSPEAVKAMSPQAITAMTPEAVNALSPQAVKAMSPQAIKAMTPEAVNALSPEAVKAISPQAIKSLTPEAVNALSPEAVKELSPAVLNQMSPEAVNAISPEAVKVMSIESIQSLSAEALQSMSIEATKAIPSEVVSKMSSEATKVISSKVTSKTSVTEEKKFTPKTIKAMSPNEIKSLSPGVISQMSPEAIKAISPEAIKVMTPDAIKALSPESVKVMCPEAIKAISPEAVRAMSPEVIKAISPEAIKVMSPEAKNSISSEAVKVLSAEAIRAKTPESIKFLSEQAQKAMSPEASSAMDSVSSELSKSSSESSFTVEKIMSVEQLDMAKRRKSSTSKEITEKHSTLKEEDVQRKLEETQRREEEEMLRMQRKERESREREMKKYEDQERKKREEQELAEKRKRQREEEDKMLKEQAEKLQKEAEERAEKRKSLKEDQLKLLKEEEEREIEEEKQKRERQSKRKEDQEIQRMEEEEKIQREDEDRRKKRKQRQLDEEKAQKEQQDKFTKEKEKMTEERKRRKEEEDMKMRAMELDREEKERKEKEERKKQRERDMGEEDKLFEEEEEKRKEKRRKRLEEEKRAWEEDERQEALRKKKVGDDKKRLEEELRKRDDEKRRKEDDLKQQGEDFLKKEDERRRKKTEERMNNEKEEREEELKKQNETDERKREERKKRQMQSMEREIEDADMRVRRSRSNTPAPSEVRRRDPRKRPKFSTKLSDRQTTRGQRVRMTCNIITPYDEEPPEVEWFKSGLPVIEDERVKTTFQNGVAAIEIIHVGRSDCGEYTCSARNRHGRVSTTMDLRIKGDDDQKPSPPTFTTSLRDRYVSDEDKLVLSCHVAGHPEPKITWLKDADKLPSSPRFQTSVSEEGICKLIITSPRAGDSGTYTCHAENRVYRDEISVNVRVQDLLEKDRKRASAQDDSEASRFVSELCDQYVEENGTLTLQVQVAGSPAPEVLWLLNGRTLNPSGKYRISAIGNTHTFTLFQVTQKDLGMYSCKISNRYGYNYSMCTVEFGTPKPKRGVSTGREEAPSFVERPESMITVYKEEEVRMSCTVSGEPTPRVTWMKGMHDISNTYRATKTVNGNTHTIVIRRAEFMDSGTYTVELKNSQGTARAFCSIKVRDGQRSRSVSPCLALEKFPSGFRAPSEERGGRNIRDVPDKVGTPQASDIGKTWVSLQWGKPEYTGGVPVAAYKIESWIMGEEARWQELGVSPICSFDAYNLKSDREYLFRVTPRNKYGWGEPVMTPRAIRTGRKIEHPNMPRSLPHQIRAMPGGSICLDAQVTGEPMPECRWYKDGSAIDFNRYPRFSSLSSEGSMHEIFGYTNKVSLNINDLRWEDEGKYELEVLNPGGRVTSYTRLNCTNDCSILEAQETINNNLMALSNQMEDVANMAPQFTMRLRERRVQVGFPVRLTCQIVAIPKPNIRWFKDGIPLDEDDCHVVWVEDGHFYTLEVSSSIHDDAGMYSVEASNSFGSVKCHARLVVDSGLRSYISPMFIRELEDQNVKEGSTLTLQCIVEAYPTVGVVWHRDGQRIRPNRKHSFSLDADGIATLNILQCDFTDGGLYTCTSSNEMGRIESMCRVSVATDMDISRKKIESSFNMEPMFVRKPRNIDAEEGDRVLIECEVAGHPKPSVTWLRDWLQPSLHSDGSRFQEVGTGPVYRLEIPQCRVEDTGAYAILAKNDNGETRGVISLQVYAKGLKGNLDPGTIRRGVMEHVPVVTRRLQDVRCCDGDSVTLEATVDAPKNSLVRWEKQGKVLKLSNDIESEWDGNKVRLRIKEVYPEDEGEYSCIVFNDQGKAVTSATVIVEMADDKENDVTVQMEHRPDMSRRTTPSCSRSITPSRWSRSPSVAFQREGSAHSWAGAGSNWRESSVSISHWRPMSRGASPMLLAHRMTPEPSPKTRARRSHGPKFYYIPHDRIVEEGESVTFQCAVKGNPTPKATWDKDAMKISGTGRVNIESKDDIRLIEIPKVTQQDAGLYRITIENDLGREQATARLDVIKSTGNKYTGYVRSWHTSPSTTPYFSRTLPSSSVLTGSRMQLSTDFRGSPAPRAKWYKNGELLPMCDEYQQTQNGKSASLEISEVESTDAGTYTCTIVSDAGKAECSCEVTVETRKDTGDLPPLFLRGLEDITSLDGDQVTLSIKLSGTCPLKVIWVRNDQEIKPSTDFRYVEGEDGEFSLVMRDVFPEDAGVYIAEAYNVHGEEHSYCRLQVHDPRLSAPSQPRIVGSLTGLEVEEGTAARFNVTVLGSPRPSLAWYIDGRKLANTPRIKVTVDEESGTSEETLHSLGILHALSTDSGVVSVVATNSLGSDTANTILKVNKYSPPSENKAQSHSNSVGNTNPAGGKSLTPGKTSPAISTSPAPRIQPTLKDFKEMGGVSSVDSGVGSVTRDSASGMSSSLSNVSELEYDKDAAGQSEKITIQSITETAKKQQQQLSITKQQQPPEPEEVEEEEEEGAEILLGPVDVTATTGQSAKFTANFIGYPEPTVSWMKKDHEIEANSRFKILTEKCSSTLSIENVTPDDCDKYTIVVRNKHAAHASFASLTVASVPDPPVEKPNLSEVTAESVTLSWYGPTYDGGSCISGYIVESRKIGQVPWNTLITGVHSTSYIARGLESGSQYEFRTRAQNVHGKSEPSKPSQPITIENKSKEDKKKEIEEEDEEYKYPPFEVKEVALEPGALYDSSYETFEEVGKGRFGVVFRCVNKETGQKRAAKIIKCIRGTEKEKVREEISIMNSLRHPKLLQLGAAYEKQREIVMVMEYITGGELFERVIAEDFALTERDCILFVRQICEGVQYMHDNMILHLDLKPENILCVHKRSHQIKLIDFGLARRFNPEDPCRVLFGTPEFIAPEIINYDPISFVSDMWSIGVVCYVLLSGLSPFMGDNDAETFANITQAEFDFDDDAFDNISEDAKSFITSLLDKRKEKRPLAKDCLKHKWLAQNEGSMNKVVISTDKLKKFIIRRKWQDVAFSKVERHNSPVPL